MNRTWRWATRSEKAHEGSSQKYMSACNAVFRRA